MKNIRKFYGEVTVRVNNLNYEDYFYEFTVEYYKTLNEFNKTKNNKFGIELIKKIKIEKNEIIERKEINNFLDSEEKADKLLEILKRNKVTPISVEEVINDLQFK